ncbi:MAG: UDP-N-acetylmuramoyl-L-alanine--D-glutamate ligase [Candidatus Omnitrophica bacterium]|nr:UDP-N-acetylmuramoyl-L-alanine--D-glutamate ligase [Candidatus Omnitrophota bacterium]
MGAAPVEAGIDAFGRSWRGRRVTVVGLGRSGLAAVEWLRRVGCEVAVTDTRPSEALSMERQRLAALGVAAVETGWHTPRCLEGAEAVIVSPGVPESTGPVAWARDAGIPVLSEIELAYDFCPSPIVAVTGTNGKSTVVTLIAEILNAAGRPAVACGNIGTPFASVLSRLTSESTAVVEVSSFQLLHCERFHPAIGVLLNLGTNHLDRHRDQAAYVAAKARLFQAQTADDWAVLNACDARIVQLAGGLSARCAWFGDNRSNPPRLRLAAETRAALTENLQAVLQISRLLGIADPLAWQVIRSFRGLEHRMESVATVEGIHFVNDSKSTTPDSLLYALRRTAGPVVVIMGGRDKGLDFAALAEPLHQPQVKGVVLIGESRNRLRALFNGSPTVRECHTLEAAVAAASELSGPGTTVLFSPACASFDMFRDFEDRGRAFKALIRAL